MFKKEAKIMAAIVTAPLFLGLIAALIGPKIFENSCENQIVKSYTSPDNKYEVVLFQRDCGATTGFSTQVSIIETGRELPRKKGNIFIADDGDTPVSLGSWGGPLLEIKWMTQDKVIIEYPKGSRVFLNENRYKAINIEYRTR
jgi:hypothetical protein